MAQLPITDNLEAKLQRVATRYGLSLTRFLEKVAEDYGGEPALISEVAPPVQATEDRVEARKAIIRKEQAAYEEQHPELFKLYADKYIAMIDGAVIDHDIDKIALKERLRVQFGKQTIFVTPVLAEPMQTIMMRSFTLVRE